MADVRITGLPVTPAVTSGSVMPVVTTSTTTQCTVLQATQAALSSLTFGTGNNVLTVGSTTNLGNNRIRATGSLTGTTAVANAISGDITFAADVTTSARVFAASPTTAAATFTCSQLVNYLSAAATKGANSTITAHMGFFADASMVQATNNYGFYGNIPATTATCWNVYVAGAAPSYFGSRVGIGGSATAPGSALEVQPTPVATGTVQGINSFVSNTGNTTTYAVMAQATGAATTGFNTGLYANASGAATNYAVRIVSPAAAANNWAIYSDAAAQSYFAGNLGLGITTPTVKLDVSQVSNGTNTTWQGGTNFMRLLASGASAFSEQAIAFQEGTNDVGAKIGVKNTGNGAYEIIFANRVNTSSTGTTLLERMRITHTGNVGIGTTSPVVALDVAGNSIRIGTPNTPTTSTAAGTAGQICWDATYLYICTTTGAAGSAVWKRLTLAAF